MREICHIGVRLSLTPFAGVNANIPIAASGKEGFENVSSRMYLTRLGQPLSRAGAEHGGLVRDLTQTQAPPPPPPPSTSHQSRLTAAAGNHPFSTGTASQVGSGAQEQLRTAPGGNEGGLFNKHPAAQWFTTHLDKPPSPPFVAAANSTLLRGVSPELSLQEGGIGNPHSLQFMEHPDAKRQRRAALLKSGPRIYVGGVQPQVTKKKMRCIYDGNFCFTFTTWPQF